MAQLPHSDPTCARHGVRRGQIDISARLIWVFEKLGWVSKVRWPRPERLARKLRTDLRWSGTDTEAGSPA